MAKRRKSSARKSSTRSAPTKTMSSGSCCSSGKTCNWCWGLQVLVLGVLVLLNHYWTNFEWGAFWGVILVICGLLKLIWPRGCNH